MCLPPQLPPSFLLSFKQYLCCLPLCQVCALCVPSRLRLVVFSEPSVATTASTSPGARSQAPIAFLQGERDKHSQSHGTGQESKPEGLQLSSPHGSLLLDPGFFPAGLDPVAVVPAAPRMPRRLQATLASLGVFLVSCLVVLFIVGKLLGDLSPTDFLSFLHTGPKEP